MIIDDIDAALTATSCLGRSILTEHCNAVRDAVKQFAARRGWTVLPHRLYEKWASDLIDKSAHRWLILDPVFSGGSAANKAMRIRVSRDVNGMGAQSITAMDEVFTGGIQEIGIVDDAAASGLTLRSLAQRAKMARVVIKHFALAASSRTARDSVLQLAPATWSEFIPGDCRVAHMRDGCAYLPYTGRRTDRPFLQAADGCAMEVRAAACTVAGSLWQVMLLDTGIKTAVTAFQRSVPAQLSTALDRPALVQDICQLGAGVSLWASSAESVTPQSFLSSVPSPT